MIRKANMKIAFSAARVALMTAILTLLPGIAAYAEKCHQSLHDSLSEQRCVEITCEDTSVSAQCLTTQHTLNKTSFINSNCGTDREVANKNGHLKCNEISEW